MASQIEKAASFIIDKCREEGIIVHRYDVQSSGSIYLKFDWGLAHSLRISDHKGIVKYRYKFNLIKGIPDVLRISYRNNNHSIYFPFREIHQCLDEILSHRKEVIAKHNSVAEYLKEMMKTKDKIERLPYEKLYPFWRHAKRGE